MKIYRLCTLIILSFLALLIGGCSLTKDDLEGADIYTTVYPINYLTKYLYKDFGNINSIYPADCDISTYELTEKQIKNYSKGSLFIYNGLTNEKELAKDLLNKNKKLLIIDVSYGLTLNNSSEELWLSPNNYLMLAKNIKDNLQDYLTSKIIIEEIEKNYIEFQEKISIMDANLHALGKKAKDNNSNIIIASDNVFKYLENYGFEVISLKDPNNLKEHKLNAIKDNFKSGTYKYILTAMEDESDDLITELSKKYKANILSVDTMTMTLKDDYFDIMTKYIENIKTIVS